MQGQHVVPRAVGGGGWWLMDMQGMSERRGGHEAGEGARGEAHWPLLGYVCMHHALVLGLLY